jgi:hypothetical protein
MELCQHFKHEIYLNVKELYSYLTSVSEHPVAYINSLLIKSRRYATIFIKTVSSLHYMFRPHLAIIQVRLLKPFTLHIYIKILRFYRYAHL